MTTNTNRVKLGVKIDIENHSRHIHVYVNYIHQQMFTRPVNTGCNTTVVIIHILYVCNIRGRALWRFELPNLEQLVNVTLLRLFCVKLRFCGYVNEIYRVPNFRLLKHCLTAMSEKRPKLQNSPSRLLNNAENEQLFNLIGNRCVVSCRIPALGTL